MESLKKTDISKNVLLDLIFYPMNSVLCSFQHRFNQEAGVKSEYFSIPGNYGFYKRRWGFLIVLSWDGAVSGVSIYR